MTEIVVSQARVFRHIKRGSIYTPIVGFKIDHDYIEDDIIPINWTEGSLIYAKAQSSSRKVIPAGTWMLAYSGQDSCMIWCRAVDEMNDGRFEVLEG